MKDCLDLAKEAAASSEEVAAVKAVETKAVTYIKAFQQGLPVIEVNPRSELKCPAAEVGAPAVDCPDVVISSTGRAKLHITRIDVTGENSDDFRVGDDCEGRWLAPAPQVGEVEACPVTVEFRPSGGGDRRPPSRSIKMSRSPTRVRT